MSRNHPPRRTGATRLKDDELLLFDAIFDGAWPLHMLEGGPGDPGTREPPPYALHLNVGWCHGLRDEGLRAALSGLESDGLIAVRESARPWRGSFEPIIELTAEGGAIWEAERRPDWSRYVTCWSSPSGDGVWEATGFTLGAVHDYLRAADRSRSFLVDWRSVGKPEVIGGSEIIAWRRGEVGWKLRFRAATPPLEERVRRWHAHTPSDDGHTWHHVAELVQLR